MLQPIIKQIMEKINLIKQNLEEIITESELASLIKSNEQLKHYIGFEISGKIHLGTGLMCMAKIRDFQKAGVDCNIFLADWHTWINDKLGGNHDLIKRIAVNYFKEGLKASLKCVGGDPENVNFVLGSNLYHNNDRFWQTVVEVSKNITLARNLRSMDIMGRSQSQSVDFAKLIYPPMQVADIFIQGINLAHAGTDQRNVHVIARDVALNLNVSPLLDSETKKIKPIAIHHHLILGLQKPDNLPENPEDLRDTKIKMKMSKSKPGSAIFITDAPDLIREKVNNAFCPKDITFNPILDWSEHLIFRMGFGPLEIKRVSKHGGNINFTNFEELKTAIVNETLHPQDLKNALAEKLIEILEPARKHFEDKKELVDEMEQLTVSK